MHSFRTSTTALRSLSLAGGLVWLFAAALILPACGRAAVLPQPAETVFDIPTGTPSITPSVTVSQPVETPQNDPPLLTDTPAPVFTATATITAWPNATHTPGPSPTRTRTPTRTRIPTQTRAPTRTPTITLTPTITYTPTPPAQVHELVRPGLLSKVVSPIQMEMYVVTGDGGLVTVDLVGEDGRVISRQVLDYGRRDRYLWAAPDLPFEIEAVAETARLQVSTQDEYGRLIALSSVDVILLSVGRNEINPPAITQEPYLVRSPQEEDVIRGGLLVLDGLARPVNDSPLLIELVNENNIAVAVKQLAVPAPTGPLSHTPFTVEIPYRVSGPTSVRLIIRQEGSRIPGTVALYSRLITLEP